MKLNLQPYDPSGDLRNRAAAALSALASEWATTPPLAVGTDARDEHEEKARAAARKWRATAGGKAWAKRRRERKRLAKLEAEAAIA